MRDFEKLGLFYLGRPVDPETRQPREGLLLYDSRDLVTHAVCVGMTGSGKTGLCLTLLEEAAIDGIPAIVIDPKGDLGNLLLTFPELGPEEFRPWINEDDARRRDLDPDAFAAAEAGRWAAGLQAWGQDGARVARLRTAADAVIYTPGSQAGIPVSVLRSFAAPPPEVRADDDLMRERVSTTATSLLGLVGVDADPIRSREHILLSTLLETAWRQGADLDVASLIQQVQAPPIARVGVLELEAFFPSKERFELAMALNNLLAAPGFAAWFEGQPLDVSRLLYAPSGRPRIAIFSIAHLGDAERMFFVSLLLNEVLGWVRTLPGTTSLRAIVYMDEIFGYLPPTANPPSKLALLTLLKQARAFGVGMVLATQNPVDLDYKALSNAGTWFIGRLQTERDQLRVLDGLEGTASAGGGFDRQTMSRLLAALGTRIFVMHNVHEGRPEVFETRWAMSYLRGPLTRAQIKMLMDARRAEFEPSAESAASRAGAAVQPAAVESPPAGAVSPKQPAAPPVSTSWILPPGIPQYFAPATEGARFGPALTGAAHVRFTDAKAGVDETREVVVVTPIGDGALAVNWADAEPAGFTVRDLATEAPPGASFADLPAAAQQAKSYREWAAAFSAWLSREQRLELLRSRELALVSRPGESERDFRIRLQQAARERRDEAVARLQQKYAPKAAALQERLRRAQQAVQKEEEQASDSKVQTVISFGTTLLGAMFGRKTISAGTIGRATTAARGVGRARKEASDVTRAQETVKALEAKVQELDAELQAQVAAIEAAHDPALAALDTLSLKPKRGGIQVQFVGLTWVAA
jgi:phage host-nuclease inhibitor protein Gam